MNPLEFLLRMARDPARRVGEHIAAERSPSTNAPVVGGMYNTPLLGLPARGIGAALNLAGLAQEPFDKAAGALTGEAFLLAMQPIIHGPGADEIAQQDPAMASLIEASKQGALHPGRVMDVLQESPDKVVRYGATGARMVANPLNYVNGIGETGAALEAAGKYPMLGRALKGAALAGEAVNRASMPIGLLSKGGREAMFAAPSFMRGAGPEASRELNPILQRLAETEAIPPVPRPDLSVLRGGKLGAPEPLGLPLIPELQDIRIAQRERGQPLATRVPDFGPSSLAPDKTPNLLQIARQAQNAAEKGPLQAPQRLPGPINPVPNEAITQAEEAAAKLLPEPPASETPFMPRELPQAVAEALPPPVATATREEALQALTGEDTRNLLGVAYEHPNAIKNAQAKYTDPLALRERAIERIQTQPGKTELLAQRHPDLAERIAALPDKVDTPATPALGGDIAAGGGGGGGLGLLPYPGGLNGAIGRAVLPAAAGGLTGAAGGAAIGAATNPDDRVGGALKGGLIGAGLGYAAGGGASMAGLDTALPKALHGTVIHPDLQRAAIEAGIANQVAVNGEKGVQGFGKQIGASRAQWRAQMVNTLKQLPQDAFTRLIVLWGIARDEFGVTGDDFRKWQAGLAQERSTGVSMLNNPVTGWFRDLGLTKQLGDLSETYGLDFGGSLTAKGGKYAGTTSEGADKYLSGGKRMMSGALTSGFAGGPSVNPISIAYGAVRGKYAPFVDGYIRFLNGIQHDAARFAMAEKALDRDVPRLADDFLFELARAGHNVKPLEGLGGRFSAADVAKVAGPQAGKDWHGLVESLVQGQGNRIAFLNGDFRKSSETAIERNIGKVAPFARWSIRYAPVLAEIAIRHPRAALLVTREMQRENAAAKDQGKRSYQRGVTVNDTTPLVGLAARARNGGGEGNLTVDPIGALLPYGNLLSGGEDLPEDATGYQKVVNAAGRFGLSPDPAIQAGAYMTGQDYRAPSALSRTAGLEAGVEAIPAAARLAGVDVPDLPQLPSGRNLLDAGREVLKPVTGEGAVAPSDPVLRRYAELVMAETRKPLSDPSNRDYLMGINNPDNPLWNLATVQARTAGAATNLTGLVSPIQTTAQSREAAQAQAAGPLPISDYQISQAAQRQQPGLRAALDRVIALNPAMATYRNINPNARRATLLAEFDLKNARLKQMAPQLYAERRKQYEASLP